MRVIILFVRCKSRILLPSFHPASVSAPLCVLPPSCVMSATHHNARPEGSFLSAVADHAQIDETNSSNLNEQDPLLPLSSPRDEASTASENGLLWLMGPALLAGCVLLASSNFTTTEHP